MSDQIITIEMTEKQLATVISGLLFSCSVNVVANTNQEYQRELFDLAKKLKMIKVDIKLDEIQFLEEEDYEDALSKEVLQEFEDNIEVITFNQFDNQL